MFSQQSQELARFAWASFQPESPQSFDVPAGHITAMARRPTRGVPVYGDFQGTDVDFIHFFSPVGLATQPPIFQPRPNVKVI
jgi:hypothetical protein